MASSAYDATIRQLEDLYGTPALPARKAGLRRIYRLLTALDNPHLAFRSVHITGSSGKGSTTSMEASILLEAGFRTGAFRSPHLSEYTERISVDGEDISRADWVDMFDVVWPSVEQMTRNAMRDYVLGRPTLIEVLFAMACMYFRERGVEWAAIEAGLGGRFDPTNSLVPDVAVVTNVSLEHTQVLGRTVAAIAAEKAAIIKPGAASVTASTEREALNVIEARARRVCSPLTVVGKDVKVKVHTSRIDSQDLSFCDPDERLHVRLPLGGSFQAANAATAYAVSRCLRARGVHIGDDAIVRGLETVQVPGRLDVLSAEPLIILDGAHNPAAAGQLAGTLRKTLGGQRVHLVFAAMADKDIERMAEALQDVTAHVYATVAPGTDRAASPSAIIGQFARWAVPAQPVDDPDDAFALARAAAGVEGTVVVTGSMYLVGWFRKASVLGRV